MAGASVSLLLVLAFREVQFTAIALILPLLLVCYMTVRSSFGRLEDSKRHVEHLNRLLLSTVETLATAIDAKDEVTHDHVRRVQQGTLGLARELGVTDAEMLKAIEAAALLHDTGKIAVPESILRKPSSLDPAEWVVMRAHSKIGSAILDNSTSQILQAGRVIALHHHERWDGGGYPNGLAVHIRSCPSSGTIMRAGTAPAIPTGSEARRFPSARASCRSWTASTH